MNDKKFSVIIILCLGLILSILVYSIYSITNEKNIITKRVGRKIILERDTLMIIDYSFINENYTLSSGVKISFKLAEKAQFVK